MNAAQARAAFEARWRGAIRAAVDPKLWKQYNALVDAGPSGVRSVSCRALHDEVQGMIGQAHTPDAFEGTLGALDRDGSCWRIGYDGHLRSGLAAAVAEDGGVLFVWVVPEG